MNNPFKNPKKGNSNTASQPVTNQLAPSTMGVPAMHPGGSFSSYPPTYSPAPPTTFIPPPPTGFPPPMGGVPPPPTDFAPVAPPPTNLYATGYGSTPPPPPTTAIPPPPTVDQLNQGITGINNGVIQGGGGGEAVPFYQVPNPTGMSGSAIPATATTTSSSSYPQTGGYSGMMRTGGIAGSIRSPLDPNLAPDPRYMDATIKKFLPGELLQKFRVPLSVVLRPLAEQSEDSEIPIVNFGSIAIARCRSCRAYINPYDEFVDNGRRWKCSICSTFNDVPTPYYSNLDEHGKRLDIMNHPELQKGQVEFVATSEYMMRPPQAPVYVFLIDVTYPSVASRMVELATITIKNLLDTYPTNNWNERSQMAIITYDSHLHFYYMKRNMKQAEMIVCSDLEDNDFIPCPDDLLVNINDCKDLLIDLLGKLSTNFNDTRISDSCLGNALQAGYNIIQNVGGKMLVFQSVLPLKGLGALKHRESSTLLGTDKERVLLNNSEPFYTKFSDLCQKKHICIDLYCFGNMYLDIASLVDLPKNTGGELYYYPNFDYNLDGMKFYYDLIRDLSRETGWEGVLRVRVSKGLRIGSWYGNCAQRTSDLIGLPNVHSDSVFVLELELDGESIIQNNYVTIQSGLLYTTSEGNRRIRCHTLSIEMTTVISEAFDSINIDCLMNVLSKRSINNVLNLGLDTARLKLQQICIEIIKSYRASVGGFSSSNSSSTMNNNNNNNNNAVGNNLQLNQALSLLPLYIMSMQKSITFRGSNDIRPDERSYYLNKCWNLPIEESKIFYYPHLRRIDDIIGSNYGNEIMINEAGEIESEIPIGSSVESSNNILIPPLMNLSCSVLKSECIYLLDDVLNIFIWIGRNANSELVKSLVGVDNIENIDCSKLFLLLNNDESDEFNIKVNNIINAIRENRSVYEKVIIVYENSNLDVIFRYRLVEDKANFPGGGYSYSEYMSSIMQSSGPCGVMGGHIMRS